MWNMFFMNNRMTIWTYNQNIILLIVFSISIFMMQTQNFRKFIKTTNFTFFDPSSSFIQFSQRCRIFNIFRFNSLCYRSALFRTKNMIFARRAIKFYITIFTCVLFRSLSFLRSMITKTRTVFSFITSRGNVFKYFATNKTIIFNFNSTTKFVFAFSRTIFSCFKSISSYIKFLFTWTNNKFSSMRFHNATC